MAEITTLVGGPLALFADSLAIALDLFTDIKVLPDRPTNGPAIVEAVVRRRPEVAVIDYWMPDMEGHAIVGAVNSQAPATKIILMFSMATPQEIQQATEVGTSGFVSKEGDVGDLAGVIRKVYLGIVPFYDRKLDYLIKPHSGSVPRLPMPFESLTPRQIEIMALLNLGLSTNQVANRLSLSPKTVRNHISEILTRTGTRSAAQALALARSHRFFRS